MAVCEQTLSDIVFSPLYVHLLPYRTDIEKQDAIM